jgi:hypothetical protein
MSVLRTLCAVHAVVTAVAAMVAMRTMVTLALRHARVAAVVAMTALRRGRWTVLAAAGSVLPVAMFRIGQQRRCRECRSGQCCPQQ